MTHELLDTSSRSHDVLSAHVDTTRATDASAFSPAAAKGRVWIDHTSELRVGAEELHALLSDIDGWPSWTPGLRAILRWNQAKEVRVGSFFCMLLKLKGAPPAPVPCSVFTLTPNVIEWGGGIGSSVIRHRFEIVSKGSGKSQLRQLEYATGLLALITRPIEKLAGNHDLAWSLAVERKFGIAQ